MKKVLVFMAILFATVISASAQTIDNGQLNPLGPLVKEGVPQQSVPQMGTLCPPCPRCWVPYHYCRKNNDTKKAPAPLSRPNSSGSFNTTNCGNTTTNNYNSYYPQSPYQYKNYQNDLPLWLLWLTLLGLLFLFLYRRMLNSSSDKHSASSSNSYTPVVTSPEEIQAAIAHAKEASAMFTKNPDGTYYIHFSRPKGVQETAKEKSGQ